MKLESLSMTELSPPRIVCSAIFFQDGEIVAIGPRHYDSIMRSQIEQFRYSENSGAIPISFIKKYGVQGFIDQHGKTYNRKEAWVIAEAEGQIRMRVGGDGPDGYGLFSENLY